MTFHEIEASVGQRLLWFLDRYRGEAGALNCPTMCRLSGELDDGWVNFALSEVLRRHESLRSTFVRRGHELVQRVANSVPLHVHRVDVSGQDDPEAALDEAVAKELATRIDATKATVRPTLWRVGPGDHVLCINMHHLVTDSWSCGIVFEDFCAALDRASGATHAEPEPGWQYREFARWQATELSGESLAAAQSYWRGKLDGMRLPGLPFTSETPDASGRETALEQGELAEPTVTALAAIARTRHTTLFAVLLTLYYVRLRALTGQDDLAIASLFANRARKEVRRTVGFLANMVLLRTRLDTAVSFTEALAATNETVLEGLVHQAMPFQLLPIRPGPGRPDDVVFQLLADPIYHTTAGGLKIEVLVPDGVGSRFEFELVLVPDGKRLRTLLFYNQARLDRDFASEFVTRFVEAANLVSIDPTIALQKIP